MIFLKKKTCRAAKSDEVLDRWSGGVMEKNSAVKLWAIKRICLNLPEIFVSNSFRYAHDNYDLMLNP